MYISKLFILSVVCLGLFYTVQCASDADYDEEAEVPKPRINPLLRRVPGARALPGSKAPTTTTTAAPKEEEAEEYDEEEAEEGTDEEEPAPTEPPKKSGIKTGALRPFRSNDDLLATLKRRRQEAKNGKSQPTVDHHSASASEKEESEPKVSKPAPKSNNAAGRRRFSAPSKAESSTAEDPAPEVKSAPKPAARSRFASRTSKPQSATEDIAGSESNQEISVQAKPGRSNYRKASRS